MTAIEDFIVSTVEPTARAVEVLARSTGVEKVNEQRHLAPSAREVVAAAVRDTPYRTALPTERRLGDRPEWPGVGDVDALVAARRARRGSS